VAGAPLGLGRDLASRKYGMFTEYLPSRPGQKKQKKVGDGWTNIPRLESREARLRMALAHYAGVPSQPDNRHHHYQTAHVHYAYHSNLPVATPPQLVSHLFSPHQPLLLSLLLSLLPFALALAHALALPL